MQIEKLKLTNFLSHACTEVDFTRVGSPALIIGKYVGGQPGESNGSGKSSLFEAILYSLFGESRAETDDGLIRLGSDAMEVVMVFKLEDVRYEIVRHKKRGKSQVVTFSDLTNDKKLRGNSVKETEMKIVDVLGMDYTVFTNTVFSPQDQLTVFPDQIPSKRKEVLSAILGLEAYTYLEEKAKRLANDYETSAKALDISIERLSAEVGSESVTELQIAEAKSTSDSLTLQVSHAREMLSQAEQAAEQARSRAQMREQLSRDISKSAEDLMRIGKQRAFQGKQRVEQLAKIDQEERAFLAAIDRESHLNGVVSEIEAKIRTYDEVAKRLSSLKEERSALGAQRDGLRRQIDGANAELNKLRERLSHVQDIGPRCPTCYSALTAEAQKKITDDIVAEGTEKRGAYDALVSQFGATDTRAKAIDKEVGGLASDVEAQGQLRRDLTRAQTEIAQCGWARTQVAGLGQRRAAVEDTCKSILAELGEEEARVTSASTIAKAEVEKYAALPEDAASQQKIEECRRQLFEVTVENDQHSQQVGALRARKEACDKKSSQLEADRLRRQQAVNQEFIYKELTRAFGKNGIPALIMDNALAEVQTEVREVMDRLTGGRIQVEFVTQKETLSGKAKETLDIVVSDASGARDFRLYSGGEKVRVAIAIRLALSRVISRRAGKRIECVMIDEIAGLDPSGVSIFAGVISQMGRHYKQVLVVTHLTELQSSFQNVVTIVKDRDGSHVETEVS